MSLSINIIKKYKSFSLKINFCTDGKPTGLLGASGCGKSLTLRCIAGIETPDSGRIVLNDRVLYDSEQKINLPPRERNVGYMFQNYALFPNMTVGENIQIAVRNKKNKKEVTEQLLTMFRLTNRRDQYPHQLSGGEQQRVALARIMAYEPEMLMLDEPFSALDSFLKDQLQQELLELLKEYRGDILMVSHSRDELYRFCQNIAIVNKGRMIEFGAKAEVFTQPHNIITAKLTGCKNISKIKRISDYEVEALDWNIILQTGKFVEEDIRYVGIRAHNIKPVRELKIEGQNEAPLVQAYENVIKINMVGFSEGPFENSIIIRNSECSSEEGKLWWIVPKQTWKEQLHEQLPSHFSLPKESLLLLREVTNS